MPNDTRTKDSQCWTNYVRLTQSQPVQISNHNVGWLQISVNDVFIFMKVPQCQQELNKIQENLTTSQHIFKGCYFFQLYILIH